MLASLVIFVYVEESQEELLADALIDVTKGNESLIRELQRHLPRKIAAD